jgi:hypothetical protein
MSEFEILLARTWETQSNELSPRYIEKTREGIASIREYYTFKKRMPSKIDYTAKKHRAGYLASFGQRHAYLPYYQLKEVAQLYSKRIPQPEHGELTVTLLGGAAAVELFGLLYFFNESTQVVRKLNVVNIEKVSEWDEVRRLYMSLLKDFFRKVTIKEYIISADLRQPCAEKFAKHHEVLIGTEILMCYNVLNENEVHEQECIVSNLRYILNMHTKPLLILLMEPSPPKSIKRVRPFKDYLASTSEILQSDIKTYRFDQEPLSIAINKGEDNDLNKKLFGPHPGGKSNPVFYNYIKRIALCASKKT